jgi:hypothetical protein
VTGRIEVEDRLTPSEEVTTMTTFKRLLLGLVPAAILAFSFGGGWHP